MRPVSTLLITLALISPTLLGAARAAETPAREDERHPSIIDPAKAGPDYGVQGEYTDARRPARGAFAVQVVALGGGTFRAVIEEGGLPGAGWNGKRPVELPGRTQDGKTTFAPAEGAGWQAEWTPGGLAVTTPAGKRVLLKKTVRHSPREGAKPPVGAIVLFNGANVREWSTGQMDAHGLLYAQLPAELQAGARGKKGQPTTRRSFHDFSLHLEFMNPFEPYNRGQGRGNCGVYLQRRYEIQILDSFGEKVGVKEHVGDICGEIYRQVATPVNVCFPPLTWQTYDIDFKAPRFDANGVKTADAVISVNLNGVPVFVNQTVTAKTGHGEPEGPTDNPFYLQDHGHPTMFRNVWVVEKDRG